MPRIKLTKSIIDSPRTPNSEVVYWDAGVPGLGVKVTPKGRKVFIVLYRIGGAGSKLRKYTIIVMKASNEWDDKNPEGCMIGEYALLARIGAAQCDELARSTQYGQQSSPRLMSAGRGEPAVAVAAR